MKVITERFILVHWVILVNDLWNRMKFDTGCSFYDVTPNNNYLFFWMKGKSLLTSNCQAEAKTIQIIEDVLKVVFFLIQKCKKLISWLLCGSNISRNRLHTFPTSEEKYLREWWRWQTGLSGPWMDVRNTVYTITDTRSQNLQRTNWI